MGLFGTATAFGQKQKGYNPTFLEGLLGSGNLTPEQEKAIRDALGIKGGSPFDNLPSFDMPPAPDFGDPFEFDPANPTFGAFTDFGGTEGIDSAIMELLKGKATRDRITGIVPDRADYERAEAAKMDEIMNAILGNREKFAANVGARGISGAGEVPRQLYREVLAPGVRAAATVSAEAQLAFGRDVTAATIAQEQLLAGSRGQWLDAGKTNAQLASTEAMFGADMESRERMEANRNALQKSIHDDNITLEVYKTQLDAQLSEYLSKMTWLTQTDVANIMGEWNARAAEAANKGAMWAAFGAFAGEVAKGLILKSDRGLKDNIRIAEHGLDEVLQLEPKRFTWKDSNLEDLGLIAQEVQKIMPKAVDKLPDSNYIGIRPMAMIAALVNSVKELKAEIDKLKAVQNA